MQVPISMTHIYRMMRVTEKGICYVNNSGHFCYVASACFKCESVEHSYFLFSMIMTYQAGFFNSIHVIKIRLLIVNF